MSYWSLLKDSVGKLSIFLLVAGFSQGEEIQIPQGIERIEIKGRSADLFALLGDKLEVLEGTVQESVEGTKLSLRVNSEDLRVEIPASYKTHISSVSGDVRVETRKPKVPCRLSIQTVSADVGLRDFSPGSLSINTVSGDVELRGKPTGAPELWKDSKYSISTVSGDVLLRGILFSNLRVSTVSGDVRIYVPEDRVPEEIAPVVFTVNTVSGELSHDVKGRTLKSRAQKGKEKSYREYDFGDLRIEERQKKFSISLTGTVEEKTLEVHKVLAGGPVGYNRVDGLVLGVAPSFGRRDGHFGRVGISRAFRRRAWQEWVELQARVFSNPAIFVMGEAFNTTATFDRWMMGDDENNLAAFLFKEDFRDYFLRKGVAFGVGLIPVKGIRLDLKYEDSDIDSVSRNAHWSLFGKDKAFRENPVNLKGRLAVFDLSLLLNLPYFDILLQHIRSQGASDFDLRRTFALLRFEREFGDHEFLARLVLGESSIDSLPFGFRFGGIGTVPAYPYKIYGGERIALLNLEYGLKIRFLKFLLFYDRGEVLKGGSDVAHDIGVGLASAGISLRVARAMTEDFGDPWKVFLRLEKRF